MTSTKGNSLETIPEVEKENEDQDREIVQVGEGPQSQTNPDTSVKEDNDKHFLIHDHPKLQVGATSGVPPELSGYSTIWRQACQPSYLWVPPLGIAENPPFSRVKDQTDNNKETPPPTPTLTVPPIEHLLGAGVRHAALMVSVSHDGSVGLGGETPVDAREGTILK